ncbi:MAG: PGF-pre-PGF domain-containing protein [Candidatus Pacearchaeota archaeon]
MDSNQSYFLRGMFILVVVLFAGFVFADSGSLAPSEAEAEDNIQLLWFNVSNVTVDGGTGVPALDNVTVALLGTASTGNITNITLSNGTNVWYNDTSGSFPKIITIGENITADTNFTLNFTLNSSATWNKTFGANITAIGNSSTGNNTLTYSTLPYNSSLVNINESTDPSVTAVERSSNTRTSITTDFTSSSKCSDSGAAASGISTCVLTSSAGTVDGAEITGLSCGTEYDITVTATDNAGNTASTTESLSTQSCGSGGSSLPVGPPQKVHSFTQITPGVVGIVSNFDSEIGVREITISVNNPAQNVKITVTKHDGKPAEVSVEKSGETYQYIQIDAENLNDGFGTASVEFRVEKSWISDKGLERNEVAAFKFDESSNVWNELETEFSSEDSTYNYYEVMLDSFSYFAISEKSLIEDSESNTTEEVPAQEKNNTWLWILIAIIVVAAGAAYIGTNSRKKK